MRETFDLYAYLDDRGYSYEADNARGWVNIRCPFPLCGDHSFHCGINLQNKFFKCWICGAKGSIDRLIMELEGIPYVAVYRILKQYQDSTLEYLKRDIMTRAVEAGASILPVECLPELTDMHKRYLSGRGFDPDELVEKYGLRSCPHFGDYKFRIIIPVFLNGVIVSFTAKAPLKEMDPPYKNCSNIASAVPMRELIYNIDSVRDTALIVEGVTDTWNMGGAGVVATFGIDYSREQVQTLVSRGIKKAVVMFDSEDFAIRRAHDLANELSALIPIVNVYELDEGDPGEMPKELVEKVRAEIFN